MILTEYSFYCFPNRWTL